MKTINNFPLPQLFIKAHFLILFSIFYSGCSSPEYVKIVKEQMDGTRIGLAPEIIVSYEISEKGYKPIEYQDFYLNGNTHLIGNFSGDSVRPIRVGTWNAFHPDGKTFATGKYLNDQQSNKWKYYHKNGEKAAVGSYLNDQKSDKWKYYYDNGEKFQIQEFKMGALNGEYEVWYPSSNKSTEGYYSNNMKDSIWNSYYDDNDEILFSKVIYNNNIIQNYNVYYKNGNQLAEGGTYKIKQNGLYKLWYENGKKAYEESFSNGVSNGNAKYWDVNENLIHNETLNESVHTIESGKTKIIKTYNEDLSKLLKVDYTYIIETDSNSVFKAQTLQVSATVDQTTSYLTGKWTAKYLSGTTAGIIEYTNGQKTGNWQSFYPNGKLVSKIKYISNDEWSEAIDINGYKWIILNPESSAYYQKTECPKGKQVYLRRLNDSYYVCHKECYKTIKTDNMKDIYEKYVSVSEILNTKNKEFRDSFSFNLDTPYPKYYDIDEPILGIRLPFKID